MGSRVLDLPKRVLEQLCSEQNQSSNFSYVHQKHFIYRNEPSSPQTAETSPRTTLQKYLNFIHVHQQNLNCRNEPSSPRTAQTNPRTILQQSKRVPPTDVALPKRVLEWFLMTISFCKCFVTVFFLVFWIPPLLVDISNSILAGSTRTCKLRFHLENLISLFSLQTLQNLLFEFKSPRDQGYSFRRKVIYSVEQPYSQV